MLAGLGGFATTFTNIASYFTVPTLGGLYSQTPLSGLAKVLGAAADMFSIGMPIYPDKYEESGGNEIGTQVLVGGMDGSVGMESSTGALSKIMDNTVVNPRTWRIHGYIGVNIENDSLLGIAAGAGAVGLPVLSHFNASFGREALNLVIRKYLKFISDARRPFKFTTSDGETVPALVQSYAIRNEANNLNWVDVDLQLQEFRFVGLSNDGQQMVIGGGSWGSVGSMVKQLARASVKTIGLRL